MKAEGGSLDSFTTHLRFSEEGPFVYRQDISPSSWRGGFDSRTDHFSTRRVAELVGARASDARAPGAWEFESPPGDSTFSRRAGARPGLISPACPVRYRGLGLRGWAGARAGFLRSEAGVQLPDPQLLVFTARYANWHRGQVESLVPVGSNPTRATPRSSSRRLAAKTPVLHTG